MDQNNPTLLSFWLFNLPIKIKWNKEIKDKIKRVFIYMIKEVDR